MGWSAFRKTGLTFHNPNRSVKGYTLFAPVRGDTVYLIDMAGQVVKRWSFADLQPFFAVLLPSGRLMVAGTDAQTTARRKAAKEEDYADLTLHYTRLGGGYTTLREVDFAGNTLWSYTNPALHHDFLHLTETDHILFPVWTVIPEEVASRVRGGERRGRGQKPPLLGDDIVEIDREGHEVARVYTWRLFDPRRDPIRPLHRRWEWTHLNSIDLDLHSGGSRRLLVSCRSISRVAIIDEEANEIVWKLGDPEVSHQHHATFVDDGNVQIFDNGMNRPLALPYSRVIEVDPRTSDIVWEYKAQPPAQFFSGHISGCQRLPMGNVLVCEGTSGRLFEITRRGEIVWEWISPFVNATSKGDLIPWIYRAYRYPVDHPAFAGRDLNPASHGNLNASLGLVG